MSTSRIRDDTQIKAIVCTKYGPPEVLKLKEVENLIPRTRTTVGLWDGH